MRTDIFQSYLKWNFFVSTASLLSMILNAMRWWQDLTTRKLLQLASGRIFTQPHFVRTLNGLSWLRYNHFPEANLDYKYDRYISIYLLIPNSWAGPMLRFSGSTVSVWHEVYSKSKKECVTLIWSDRIKFRRHLLPTPYLKIKMTLMTEICCTTGSTWKINW